MTKQILFIHIPKTAGTSFRQAAQKYFGREHTFFDYNLSSVETSKEIRDCVYEKQDMYALSQEFQKHKDLFLCGHFPAGKYMPLFETLNIVTFVRDPIEQVLSHYKHYKTHHGYKDDLKHFVKEKRFKNMQSRMLKAKPLELYGFIGLTEEYSKSIELINNYYGINIEELSANISVKNDLTSKSLDNETLDLIKKENNADIRMYKKVKSIFLERVKCFEKNECYTHLLIQKKTNRMIRGCAFSQDLSDPAVIEIHSYDKILSIAKAKTFRKGLLSHGLPRKGFVGFEYIFKDPQENKSFSHLKVKSLI